MTTLEDKAIWQHHLLLSPSMRLSYHIAHREDIDTANSFAQGVAWSDVSIAAAVTQQIDNAVYCGAGNSPTAVY